MTPMFWSKQIEHFKSLAVVEAQDLADYIERRRRLHSDGSWQAIDHLASDAVASLFGEGPAYTRNTLAPLVALVPEAVTRYLSTVDGDYPLSTMTLEILEAINLFDVLGFDMDRRLYDRCADLLARVQTSRNDTDLRWTHWEKGFIALALNAEPAWRDVAGLMPGPVPFSPGRKFGANIQGLLVHLAGAIGSHAGLDDVMPAWTETLVEFRAIYRAHELNYEVLPWIARLIYHEVGREPLGRVAERLFADVQQLAAAGV